MYYRKLALALAVAFFFLFATLATSGEHLLPQKYFLDNGLEVILVEMHKSPIIIQQLYYKVGSRNEPVGQTGISHVVEHMMFKGTSKFPAGSISKLIRRNSGVFNAYTSNDVTVYFEQMPRNKIDIALEIEADRMANSIFDPEEFEREIEVIKEERRLRIENSPARIFQEELQATFYMSHPYHWPVIGWMNDLNNITREDAFRYYRTYYTPNNAVLVLVGDFETSQMLKKVKKYFGKIPAGPALQKLTIQEPEIRTKKSVTKRSVSVVNPEYHIYFQGVNYTSMDYPALALADHILSRGRTARLYGKLIESKLCRNFSLAVKRNIDMAPIVIRAELFPETDLDTVAAIIKSEIERLKIEPVTARELKREKNRYLVAEAYENMKVSEVASRLGNYEVKAGDYQFYHELRDAFQKVTAADIQDAVTKYFDFDHMVEGYLLPGDSLALPEEKMVSLAEEGDIVGDHNFIAADEEAEVEETREFNPEDFILPNPIAPQLNKFKLSNGIEVIFYEDHTFPIIELNGIIDIGNAATFRGKQNVGQFTANMVSRGSQNFPYQVLIDTLSMLSASVNFSGGEENVLFSWGTVKENFGELTAIGTDLLKNPQFPEEEFLRDKKRRIALLKSAEKQTGWNISRYVVEQIFHDHPYFGELSVANLEAVTLEDIKAFYETYFHPQLTRLVIIGDISKPELHSILERYFGTWKTDREPAIREFPPQEPLQNLDIKVFTNYEDSQVTLRIAHEAPESSHPDYEKLELANHILGGSSLTSRLGINIRDKQGLTYGIISKLRGRNHGGWWYVGGKTSPENVGKMFVSTLYEIQRMRESKVTENELNDAKRFFLGTLPMVVETPGDIMHILMDQIRSYKPLNDFDHYAERLLAITREDVLNVSQKYFHPERSVIVVGGPITPDELYQLYKEAIAAFNVELPIKIEPEMIGTIN
ncbi:MAG: pitrilysin family protein [Calditrichia bacterium]